MDSVIRIRTSGIAATGTPGARLDAFLDVSEADPSPTTWHATAAA